MEWIDAFITLNDLANKYFDLSINEKDKRKAKRHRETSEQYDRLIGKLIQKQP